MQHCGRNRSRSPGYRSSRLSRCRHRDSRSGCRCTLRDGDLAVVLPPRQMRILQRSRFLRWPRLPTTARLHCRHGRGAGRSARFASGSYTPLPRSAHGVQDHDKRPAIDGGIGSVNDGNALVVVEQRLCSGPGDLLEINRELVAVVERHVSRCTIRRAGGRRRGCECRSPRIRYGRGNPAADVGTALTRKNY